MATDKDRYAPLKESQPELPNKQPEQGHVVEQDRPPIWTHEGGRVEQEQSARDMIKYHNSQREKSRNEAGRDAPGAPEPERAHSPNYQELKVERAKSVGQEREEGGEKKKEGERKLAFFEDKNPEHGHDRSRGR